MNIEKTKFIGIFEGWQDKKRVFFTKSIDGKNFFNEFCIDDYIEFNPKRSKLSAAIIKKISLVPIKENMKILYLGAAHGYTASHISNMIKNGMMFCLDFAPRVVRDLYFICEERKNMAPILGDANDPDAYKSRVEQVDLIYQDIAQKNQVEILFKNLQFLKNNGHVLLAVKSRSIDVTKRPAEIFNAVEKQLSQKLKVIDKKELDPFEKDHCFIFAKKR